MTRKKLGARGTTLLFSASSPVRSGGARSRGKKFRTLSLVSQEGGTGKKNRLAYEGNGTRLLVRSRERGRRGRRGKCDHKAATAMWEVKRAEWRGF